MADLDLELSKRATEQYKERLFVGVSTTEGCDTPSFAKAAENAFTLSEIDEKAKVEQLRMVEFTCNAISEYVIIFVKEKKPPV